MDTEKRWIKEIKLEIRSIIISETCHMTIPDLIKDYKKIVGKNLPSLLHGYKNLEHFLKEECNDILQLKNFNNEIILCPIVSRASENINKLICNSKSSKFKPKHFSRNTIFAANKNHRYKSWKSSNNGKHEERNMHELILTVNRNLKLLIEEKQEIWSLDLEDAYENKFGESLPYSQWGYRDVVQLCSNLPDIFIVLKDNKRCDYKLCDRSRQLNEVAQQNLEKHNEQSDLLCNNTINKTYLKFPNKRFEFPDVCSDSTNNIFTIPKSSSPLKNSEIDIFITKIENPSYFWFQIRDENCIKTLNLLNDDMNNFYNNGTPKMARTMIKPGQYCVVLYFGVFYRAVIMSLIDNANVEVRCIDFGTVMYVSIDHIYMLFKKYADLSALALKGCLVGIEPVHKRWSSAAIERFKSLVHDKNLTARVVKINDDDVLHLQVIDATSSIDIVMSNVLYNEGFASIDPSSMEYWNNINTLYYMTEFKIRKALFSN